MVAKHTSEYFQTIAEAKIKIGYQQWQRESVDLHILALVAESEASEVVKLQGILKLLRRYYYK